MYTTLEYFGNYVIQTSPSKFDERLFSEIGYICADYVRNTEDKYGFYILRERERERETRVNMCVCVCVYVCVRARASDQTRVRVCVCVCVCV